MADTPKESAPKPGDDVMAAVAKATRAVAADIIEEASAARNAEKPKRSWEPLVLGLLSVAIIMAWVVFPPTVDTADPRAPVRVEMDLKIGIASLARQIEDYRVAKGALPRSLDEAGAGWQSIRYTGIDATTYELSASDGSVSVTYRSTQPLEQFARGLFANGAKP